MYKYILVCKYVYITAVTAVGVSHVFNKHYLAIFMVIFRNKYVLVRPETYILRHLWWCSTNKTRKTQKKKASDIDILYLNTLNHTHILK